MSNKKGEAALILLIAIGGAIFLIIKIIVEFIAENWVGISIAIGLLLVSFLIFKVYVKWRTKKVKQKELVKSKREKYNQQIREKNSLLQIKFDKIAQQINNSKNSILGRLEELKRNINSTSFHNYPPKTPTKNLGEFEPLSSYDNCNYEDCLLVVKNLENLLKMSKNNRIDPWVLLSDNGQFEEPNPKKKYEPLLKRIFVVSPKFLKIDDFLIDQRIINEVENDSIKQDSIRIEENVKEKNKILTDHFESAVTEVTKYKDEIQKLINNNHTDWLGRKNDFLRNKDAHNMSIDKLKIDYLSKSCASIQMFNQRLLENIEYLPNAILSVQTSYQKDNEVLIIEYLLPDIDVFPKIKDRRYLKTKNGYKNIEFTAKEIQSFYEEVIYKITLNSIHNVFKNDEIDTIHSVVFNGINNSINKATGLRNNTCIMSLSCTKLEFMELKLDRVDAKSCFRKLKGIAAPKLADLVPIRPIQSISKDDKRFIDGQIVEIDSSTNLASMDWQEFEHLIRELFEKEFSSNGGEVKVTQSSRDGGVDAIAYDPDPLRGGKTIIQAKRYTNTVGLSAVRDLYGTTMNEGANRGILVTTSGYGPDAYDFAKNKPLTLIDGQNLLHLLKRHNYNAKINIEEARQQIENNKEDNG